MKNNIYIILILACVAFILYSCEEKDRAFPEYADLEKGALPRLIDGINGSFDIKNLGIAAIDFTVEFYDENQGKNISSYEWEVAFKNNDGQGAASTDFVPIKSYSKSDFGTSEFGLPSVTVNITLQEVLNALSIANDQINAGDQFEFRATLTKDNGKTFTVNNTGVNLISSAPFSGFFFFRQALVCASDLGGTYNSTATGTSTDECCPTETTVTGTITLTDLGGGTYEISKFAGGLYCEWYAIYGITPAHQVGRIQDICSNISLLTSQDAFGGTLEASGTVDEETGVITYTWSNSFGDMGTVTLTPQ